MCKYVEFAFLMLHDLDKLEDLAIHYSQVLPKGDLTFTAINIVSLIIMAVSKLYYFHRKTASQKRDSSFEVLNNDFWKNSILFA